MDDKDCRDALVKLAEFRTTRVASRRDHEWKVTVALWALLAVGILYLPQKHPSHCWLAWALVLVVLGLAFLWVGDHWANSRQGILASFFYADRARNLALPTEKKDPPQPWPEMSLLKKWFGFLWFKRCWAQIATTVALAIGVWLANAHG
jgi:hypothetical protein